MELSDITLSKIQVASEHTLRRWHNLLHKDYSGSEEDARKHAAITYEFMKRNIEHKDIDDKLDREAPGADKVKKALEKHFKEFVWVPDFISLSGVPLAKKEDRNKDIVLRCNNENGILTLKIDESFFIKFDKIMEDCFPSSTIRTVASYFGPNWTHLPLADLVIRPHNPFQVTMVKEEEYATEYYKRLSVATSTIHKECEISCKKGKVAPLRHFYFPELLRLQKISSEPETIESAAEEMIYPCTVRPYVTGLNCMIHKRNDRVCIYLKDGSDVSHSFPELVEKVKSIEALESLVVQAVIEGWTDEFFLNAEQMKRTIKEKNDIDFNITCYLLDVAYKNNNSIHGSSKSKRIKALTEITEYFDGPEFCVIPYLIARAADELIELGNSLMEKGGISGLVIESIDENLPLDGKALSNSLYIKKNTLLTGMLTGELETTNKGKIYSFTIRKQDADVIFTGSTLPTEIKYEKGDIVELEVSSITSIDNEKLVNDARIIKQLDSSCELTALKTLEEKMEQKLSGKSRVIPDCNNCKYFDKGWCTYLGRRLSSDDKKCALKYYQSI